MARQLVALQLQGTGARAHVVARTALLALFLVYCAPGAQASVSITTFGTDSVGAVGANEVPAVNDNYTALTNASMVMDIFTEGGSDSVLHYTIFSEGVGQAAGDAVVGLGIYAGAAGAEKGDLVIDLTEHTNLTEFTQLGIAINVILVNTTATDAITLNPSQFCLDIQTLQHPSGAARGQLIAPSTADPVVSLSFMHVYEASLLATNVVGAEDTATGVGGSGLFQIIIAPPNAYIIFDYGSSSISDYISGQIYAGSAGSTGSSVIDLSTNTSDYSQVPFVASLLQSIDLVTAEAIVVDPSGFYFQIDTTSFPSGYIRGQLDHTGFETTLEVGSSTPSPASPPVSTSPAPVAASPSPAPPVTSPPPPVATGSPPPVATSPPPSESPPPPSPPPAASSPSPPPPATATSPPAATATTSSPPPAATTTTSSPPPPATTTTSSPSPASTTPSSPPPSSPSVYKAPATPPPNAAPSLQPIWALWGALAAVLVFVTL